MLAPLETVVSNGDQSSTPWINILQQDISFWLFSNGAWDLEFDTKRDPVTQAPFGIFFTYSAARSTFKALSPLGVDVISNLTLSPSLRTR